MRHGASRIWVLFLEAQCRKKVVAAVDVADGDGGGCRERDNDGGGKKAGSV